jgi:phosphate transport system substrate-binding protein
MTLGGVVSGLAQDFSLKSSDTLLGLGQALAGAYMKGHPGVKIAVSGGQTAACFDALREKLAQIAQAPRGIRYKEAQACETVFGKRPAEYKIGVNGLAVYAHKDNPVKVLTYDDLEALFRGQYTNWKQVGGQDAAVHVYTQPANSTAGELFQEEVLNGKDFAAEARALPGPELLRALAQDPNGIGYGALGPAEGLRVVPIKRVISSTPVTPSETTISKRIYPISRYLYDYVNPASVQGEIKSYLDWVRSDAGQSVVKAAGYYPLPARLRAGP